MLISHENLWKTSQNASGEKYEYKRNVHRQYEKNIQNNIFHNYFQFNFHNYSYLQFSENVCIYKLSFNCYVSALCNHWNMHEH